jgi:hypothetical protein
LRTNYEDEVPFTDAHFLRRGCGGGAASPAEEDVGRPEARANIFHI